jgi:transcriptional regulator with XRE-family HTH domain
MTALPGATGYSPTPGAIFRWRNSMPKTLNPVDKAIGAKVRMRRMMLGMSQEKLGDALGLTFQQVQKYEKGTNRIGGSRMVQIAHALDVSPGWFYEGMTPVIGGPPYGDPIAELALTREGLALAVAYGKLPPPLRSIVAKVAELFVEAAAGK